MAAVTADPMPNKRPLVRDGVEDELPAVGEDDDAPAFSSAHAIIPSQPPFDSTNCLIGSEEK